MPEQTFKEMFAELNPEALESLVSDMNHICELHRDMDLIVLQKTKEGSLITEKGSALRKKDFLKQHPEADLDGDGMISKEEAQAFAAKLQEKSKTKVKKEQ